MDLFPGAGVNVTVAGDGGSLGPSFVGLELLNRLKPLFLLLYAVLVVVACVGNSLLVLLISTTKKLHNTTNFLIGNLAASDLVMCLLCVPLTVSYAFERRGWLFGVFMCHFVTLMQAASVFVSVLSLTAIAVDRYVVVIYPVHRRIRPRSCAYVVVLIWLLSLAISAPASLHTRYLDLNRTGHDMIVCEEFWNDLERLRLLYSCSVLLLFYMLPLCTVSISYCAIGRHLRKRRVPGAAVCGQERWSSRKRKTFRRLTISILAFALCWMPLQTVNLIRDIDLDFTIMGKRYTNVIQICCHLVAMSSACYNPFIYASLHHKLRLRITCTMGLVNQDNI
uniref:G-protein coupled receptors family 1 profile domain-containing protein n=1 Tax=Callorhinchus milii TaxID=7868 RepID=A0A4W3JXX4_CALMI